jgi:hypothetical protein
MVTWPDPVAAAELPRRGAAAHPLAAPAVFQDLSEEATLETIRPEVEWSPAGTTNWRAADARQTIRAGDRVRTGPGASARLVFFEGTSTELGPGTAILVQRLERSPSGNIVSRLFQAVGTTINRVAQLVDATASFEVETPAATAYVRGTTERIEVEPSGVTRVANLPEASGPAGVAPAPSPGMPAESPALTAPTR